MALELLVSVLGGKTPFDEVWAHHQGLNRLDEKDRGFLRHLCATTLRRLGQIDALIDHCLSKPLPKRARDIRYILRIGIAQILFLQTPPHAAVDTSVNLAEVYGFQAQKGFVNAVLRRIVHEGDILLADQDAARLNTPDWLWKSWSIAYGEETARAIAAAHTNEPPLDITVKDHADVWAAKLEGIVLPNGTIRRSLGGAVGDLSGFGEGAWWVQDAAASLPVKLLGSIAGQSIIDLCAAPGGKTAQLAHAGAHVTSLDRAEGRLKTLRENLTRLGLSADVIKADVLDWQPQQPADGVLIDVPCTSTGTIRRHPDIPWLKRPANVAEISIQQQKLLNAAAAMVRPGGLLMYCSCSLQVEEGPAQITDFLNSHPDFTRDRITEDEVFGHADWLTTHGELRTLPSHLSEQGGIDGFFAVRLLRSQLKPRSTKPLPLGL